MLEQFTQDKHLLKIETPLGKDELILTAFHGEEKISELFYYELELFSTKAAISATDIIGKSVTWQIQSAGEPIRYFNGFVCDFSAGEFLLRGHRRYRATIVPWLWFLTQTQNCQIFQNKSIPAIIQQIFADYGYSTSDFNVQGLQATYAELDYCVQYNESAYNFITRLLQKAGIFYYFKHEKNKHTLFLADQNTAFKSNKTAELSLDSDESANNIISQWEHRYQFCPGKAAQTDYNFETPSASLLGTFSSNLQQSQAAKLEIYHYPGQYKNKSEANTTAKLQMEKYQTNVSKATASSHYPELSTGSVFKLKSRSSPDEQDSYVITGIQHAAADNTYFNSTEFEQGESGYINHFICIPEKVTYRPTYFPEIPSVQGPQTAIVVGPQGEEVYTDKYGRIKVKFHWDRNPKKDETCSCWIRVAQLSTGNKWGSIFNPRIGQEVIVDFLEGDPDKPIIIGSVYNAENMPSVDLETHANQYKSGIKTCSEKGNAQTFNELRFEDNKDKELIYVHAQKDFTREVKHDDALTVENNQTIQIKNNREEVVAEGNETVTIKKGQRSVTVESGNDTHEIKQGNRAVKINMGNDNLTISQGNQTVKLNLGKSSTEAMQGIEFTVGQSSIKIDQTGVTISGLMVKINGQTLVETKAGALLTLKGGITMIN